MNDDGGPDRERHLRFMLYRAELTEPIVAAFYHVHRVLGHGHLESVYERAMEIELRRRGLPVERQVPVTVYYEGEEVGYFVADLVVSGSVIVELKAAARLTAAHEAQLINYLCCSNMEIGLLCNFGVEPQVSRFVGPEARRRSR